MRNRALSKRQRECLEGRRQRLSAKQIGRQLNISPNTVIMHWRLAKLKLAAEEDPVNLPRLPAQNPLSRLDDLRQIDWVSVLAATAHAIAAALTLILILALLSLLIVSELSLSISKPYYNLFG
jgi:DNA-binding NarL/FixJ family response regulator